MIEEILNAKLLKLTWLNERNEIYAEISLIGRRMLDVCKVQMNSNWTNDICDKLKV